MEDAHIAALNVAQIKAAESKDDSDESIAIFGVFDGHGGIFSVHIRSFIASMSYKHPSFILGKEVSCFCKIHFISELVKLPSFYNRDFQTALIENFHLMDAQ